MSRAFRNQIQTFPNKAVATRYQKRYIYICMFCGAKYIYPGYPLLYETSSNLTKTNLFLCEFCPDLRVHMAS